jgi:hypothetical protein
MVVEGGRGVNRRHRNYSVDERVWYRFPDHYILSKTHSTSCTLHLLVWTHHDHSTLFTLLLYVPVNTSAALPSMRYNLVSK